MIDNYLILLISYFLLYFFIIVLLFVIFRIFKFNRYLDHSQNLAKSQKRKIIIHRDRVVINPISNIGTNFFKIIKLNSQINFKNFLDYDINLFTIFTKREKTNENHQDSV